MAALNPSIERLKKKLEKEPNPLIFLQLAEEYRKEGLFQEALKVCSDGLKKHPNYWSTRVTMGRVHYEMGDAVKARDELEKVIKAVPDNLLANRLLGDIYYQSNRSADALKRYRLVQMLSPADEEVADNIQRIEAGLAYGQKAAPVAPPPPEPAPVVNPVADSLPPAIPELPAFAEATAPGTAPGIFLPQSAGEPSLAAPTTQMQSPTPMQPPSPATVEIPAADEALFGNLGSRISAPPAEIQMPEFTDFEPAASEPQQAPPPVPSEEPLPAAFVAASDVPSVSSPADLDRTFPSSAAFDQDDEPAQEPEPSVDGQMAAMLFESTYSNDPVSSSLDDPSDLPPLPDAHFTDFRSEEPAPAVIKPEDRTQPMEQEEPAEADADELNTQTLAELYIKQGYTDKAIKVYQKLLLNDPNNTQIQQRLKDLSPAEALMASAARDENVKSRPKPANEPLVTPVVKTGGLPNVLEERKRKISTLENWLSSIRRERS